jgi:hypothetical protein
MNVTAMQKADRSKSLRRIHLATNKPYMANIAPDKPHDGAEPRRKKKASDAIANPTATTRLNRL